MRIIEIWGQLAFTGGAAQAWQARDVDPSAWSDWPTALSASVPAGRVAELLSRYQSWEAEPEYLRIEAGFPWKVRGVVSEEWFRDVGLVLAALFRSAASDGAKGEITFASDDDDVRVRLSLEGGEAQVSVPALRSVRRAADQKARAALVRNVAPSRTETDVALRDAVLSALDDVGESALQEAIRLHAPNHMAKWRFATSSEIRAAMRDQAWPLGHLLVCLAYASPRAAEPLAFQALALADLEVRRRALSALGLVGSEAAVERLLAELTAPVLAAGYNKSPHLGANWGLRHLRAPALRRRVVDVAAAYAARVDRHADIERLFTAIVASFEA